MRTFFKHCAVTALAAGLAFSAPVTVLAETVGKMTAVQTQVRKAGSGVMNIGSGVSMGDRLSSNATGLGMIVFKDQSSAKLGPNSVLTIDEFVYGGGGGGSFGISMDRGVSRFYGGQVSKKGQMKVTTPHVILGVRGGIVETKVEGGKTVGILRAGKLTCFLNDQVQVITKPGFACVSDGGNLQVVKFPNALEVLDSPAEIAGTNVPGQRGPGIEVDAGCSGAGASLMPACQSRNGQLPTPGGGSRLPTNPDGLIRTGPNDDCYPDC